MSDHAIGSYVREQSGPDRSLADALKGIILQTAPGFAGELTETTSLIRSGLVDSLGLIVLAKFIERQAGRRLDLGAVDLAQEWETIRDIVGFIGKTR